MKTIALTLSLIAAAFVVIGCQTVHVKDTAGEPVSFASVQVVGKEGPEGLPVMSGMFGEAMLPTPMGDPGPQTITVTKDGYSPTRVNRRAGDMDITVRKLNPARPNSRQPVMRPARPTAPTAPNPNAQPPAGRAETQE
jgi:predicted small secreted protein